MATVHFGRLLGPVGFSRTVAIKRLHAQFATDPEFVSMFLDEARLAARIRHPNVVPTLDVVALNSELFLVMDYVAGESLANLAKISAKRREPIPHRIISAIVSGALHGLHAAHEAKDERGMPLGIVHRDVSPQNVHVGTDGVARVLDFGVAKAAGRVQTTREGQLKGKLSYMAPEQLRGAQVNRTCDIYAVGVMLWELITGQRLFDGDNEGVVIARVLEGRIEAPSIVMMRNSPVTLNSKMYDALARLDACVMRSLHKDPTQRFQTAREMALELEACVNPATLSQVGEWVEETAKDVLNKRLAVVSEIESYASEPGFERPSEVQRAAAIAGDSSRQMSVSAEANHPVHADPMGTPTPGGMQNSTVSTFSRATSVRPGRREWVWVVAGGVVLAILAGIALQVLTDDPTYAMSSSAPLSKLPSLEPSAPVIPTASAAPVVSSAAVAPPPPQPSKTTSHRTNPDKGQNQNPNPNQGQGGGSKKCEWESYTDDKGMTRYRKPPGCP